MIRVAAHVAGAVLALAALSAGPAQAQTSYPMTCRGGGSLSIANAGGAVQIRFQAGPGAAPMGMAPGQCTWSDRALRSGEPLVICDSPARASGYAGRLLLPSEYTILQVYNTGAGCMQVTRVGP